MQNNRNLCLGESKGLPHESWNSHLCCFRYLMGIIKLWSFRICNRYFKQLWIYHRESSCSSLCTSRTRILADCRCLIAGIAAKEVVVSSCSVLFGVQNITTTDGMSTMVATLGALGFGAANAYALMVFCLLYIPCTATIATINREVESKKLTALIIFFQFAVAWVMSFLVYHIGLLF